MLCESLDSQHGHHGGPTVALSPHHVLDIPSEYIRNRSLSCAGQGFFVGSETASTPGPGTGDRLGLPMGERRVATLLPDMRRGHPDRNQEHDCLFLKRWHALPPAYEALQHGTLWR